MFFFFLFFFFVVVVIDNLEYEDYDENLNDDYMMMMITNTPSIIYDPYEIQSRKKPDFSIEGRYHFNTDP